MSRLILPLVFLVSLLFSGSKCTSATPCNMHKTAVTISASATRVKVGEVVTVTLTLSNQGCIPLGNVSGGCSYLYEGEAPPLISVEEEGKALSQTPLPFFVQPGTSVSRQFIYRAIRPGCVTFTGHAQYLVVLDADDSYMEAVESVPLTVEVTP